MDGIIAIKLGINHTSNACLIDYNKPRDMVEFNVMFETKSNTRLQNQSHTTPTVALFDDKGTIQSYGSEAELQHIQLENSSNHLLFREFIWDLFCSEETVPENLTAVNEREMKSIDVLTAVLCHMISHIKSEKVLQGLPLTLRYVLIIPTCACTDSREFMTEAAVKAGCPSENIKIVEEAAAALQFCLSNKQDGGKTLLSEHFGRKYIVVECEEDKAIMSVLQYINGNIIEIEHKAFKEIWKECHVLNDFNEMISSETRQTLLDVFKKYPLEYYDFLQEVKSKLRMTSSDYSRLNINISSTMLEEIRCSKAIQKSVLRTGHKEELKFRGDKCVIKSDRFQNLLTDAGKRIVDYIEKELFTIFGDINHIVLVGEFAPSPTLQGIIKTSFSAKNIIIPHEANMAAIRGAVFFGLRSISVETNILNDMQRTPLNNAQVVLPKKYGIEMRQKGNLKPSRNKSKKKSKPKRCRIM